MQVAKFLRPVILGLILCVSHSRTFSLIHGYSAPLEIYKHFEHHDDVGTGENPFICLWDLMLLVKFWLCYFSFMASS